jgi:hypothetical protein
MATGPPSEDEEGLFRHPNTKKPSITIDKSRFFIKLLLIENK